MIFVFTKPKIRKAIISPAAGLINQLATMLKTLLQFIIPDVSTQPPKCIIPMVIPAPQIPPTIE